MTGTQIVVPQEFAGANVEGLPVLVHGLPYNPSHRWLPYAASVAIGGKIATLKDQVGNSPLAQSAAGQQPTLAAAASGMPFAVFPGATDATLTGSVAAPAGGVTMALVFRARSAPSGEYLARFGGQNIAIDGSGFVISANLNSYTAVGTEKRVVVVSFGPNNSILSVSGAAVRTGAGVAPTTDPIVFLALAPNTRDFEIYEFAVFDAALTTGQVATLQKTLSETWEV